MGQILSQWWLEFVPKGRDSYGYMQRSANFNDEVAQGLSSVRAEEERVERED